MPCVNHPDRDSTAKCVTCDAEICDECRTEVDGKNYCPKDVPQAAPPPAAPPPSAAAPPTGAPPPPPPQPAAAPVAGTDDPSQEQPVMAALSYIIGILAIVILVTDMKKSRYMRFHGFQALFMIAVWIAFWVVVTIIGMLPMIGMLTIIIGPLGGLGLFILEIILAIKAYNKQDLELPVITKLAREQADKMRV